MLGLADRGAGDRSVRSGDAGRTSPPRSMASRGCTTRAPIPPPILTALADFVHLVTRLKLVPDAARDPALTERGARRAGKAFAATLGLPVLTRAWQMLSKGLDGHQGRAPRARRRRHGARAPRLCGRSADARRGDPPAPEPGGRGRFTPARSPVSGRHPGCRSRAARPRWARRCCGGRRRVAPAGGQRRRTSPSALLEPASERVTDPESARCPARSRTSSPLRSRTATSSCRMALEKRRPPGAAGPRQALNSRPCRVPRRIARRPVDCGGSTDWTGQRWMVAVVASRGHADAAGARRGRPPRRAATNSPPIRWSPGSWQLFPGSRVIPLEVEPEAPEAEPEPAAPETRAARASTARSSTPSSDPTTTASMPTISEAQRRGEPPKEAGP